MTKAKLWAMTVIAYTTTDKSVSSRDIIERADTITRAYEERFPQDSQGTRFRTDSLTTTAALSDRSQVLASTIPKGTTDGV